MSVRKELEKLHRALGGRRTFELACMSDAQLLAEADRAAKRLRTRGPVDLGDMARIVADPEYRAALDERFANVSDDELRAMYEEARAQLAAKDPRWRS